ncbi:MAG TPA: hypothetical protein DD727_07470 [Clostridiales bacterium]|nr:hypothetical protein [Clostridiales bacterium]
MILLLGTLISLWLALKRRKDISAREDWLIHAPISIYLGWISVAAIANIAALLVDVGWTGFGLSESFWTVLVMAVATLITFAFLARFRNIAHSLVVIWAFIGILTKHLTTFEGEYTAVITAAIAFMTVILLGIIITLANNLKIVK